MWPGTPSGFFHPATRRSQRVKAQGHRSPRRLLVAGLVAACGAAVVLAGGPARAAEVPVAQGPADDAAPRAAYSPVAHEYLVVWQSGDAAPGVRAARLGADGTLLAPDLVLAGDPAPEGRPDVACRAGAAEYLVVYEQGTASGGRGVYAVVVDAAGTPVNGPFPVDGTGADLPPGTGTGGGGEGPIVVVSPGANSRPRVAYSPADDRYLVVWEHQESDESAVASVQGRLLAPDGTPAGPVLDIAPGAADASAPAVASGAGGYLVVWQEAGASGTYGVWARRVGPEGEIGPPTPVSAGEDDRVRPDVAFGLSGGGFLVVWEDHRRGPLGGPDVYAQRLDAEGVPVGESAAVSQAAEGRHEAPAAAYLPSAGEFLVAWAYEAIPARHEVFRRRVRADGTPAGGEAGLGGFPLHGEPPALAPDGAWSALAAWADERDAASSGWDVYAAVVGPWRFAGHVYGGPGPDAAPVLSGVTVELHCSDSPDPPGTLLTAAVTDADGFYELPLWEPCEYANLIERDPPGYASVASRSPAGEAAGPNRIRYAMGPVASRFLPDNDFWDAVDPPPGDWHAFTPSDWVEEQQVTCAVRVSDLGSGLDVSSAEYAFSTDGGTTWSGWLPARCTGTDGSTGVETVTAASVPFGQDSGPAARNRVRFRIADRAGNMGLSPAYEVPVDSAAPAFVDGPSATATGPTSAVVRWETDEACTGVVEYGLRAGAFGLARAAPGRAAGQAVTLTDLVPGATYALRVKATDVAGKTTASRELFFRTLLPPDPVEPRVSLVEPEAYQGVVTIAADASDDQGVEKVEYYLDGALVYTAYGSAFGFTVDTARWANGAHTLRAVAYDRSGNTWEDRRTIDVTNLVDRRAPTVSITSPSADGAVVSGTVQVTADLTDDAGLAQAFFRVDGRYQGFRPLPGHPKSAEVSFPWDAGAAAAGEHTLSVEVFDADTPYAKSASATRTVRVVRAPPPSQPAPRLTVSHSVERHGSYFAVAVDVVNRGDAPARNVRIQDYLKGFQPVSSVEMTPVYAGYEARYDPYKKEWQCVITSLEDIPAAGSRTFTYFAVPVLAEKGPADPKIGFLTGLHYDRDPQGLTIHDWFAAPPARVWGGGETIAEAYDRAVKGSDYLLVTHPARLFAYGNAHTTDANGVLSDMAELARYRGGVLGFLETYDKTVLRNLLKAKYFPGGTMFPESVWSVGTWSKALRDDWPVRGYLLLVGEADVVPAWSRKLGSHKTVRGPFTWVADPTDYPYASTYGDDFRPELSMGRIVGDVSAALRTALRVEIGLARGLPAYRFDRSHAMLVTGFPRSLGGGSMPLNPKAESQLVLKALQGHTRLPSATVNLWHTPDYTRRAPDGSIDPAATRSAILQKFFSDLPGADVVFLAGHGNWSSWDQIPASAFPPRTDPFGPANPFVFASSCETGKYTNGYSLAEAFLEKGAAGYLGATILGACNSNGVCPNSDRFFGWWGASTPVGLALKLTKQTLGTSLLDRVWGGIYHLFGDPKFGAVGAGAPARAAATGEAGTPLPEDGIAEVTVPGYAVRDDEGYVHATVPGGGELWQTGMPVVPFYQVRYDLAPGVRVQDVTLAGRGGHSVEQGPVLATAALGRIGSEDPVYEVPPDVIPDWWPDREFEWEVVEDGRTSSLVLTIYPLRYNHRTREISFFSTYTFRVDTLVSSAEITALAADRPAYDPGEVARIAFRARNTGAPLDAVVEIVVEDEAGIEPPQGLYLDTLTDLQGEAGWTGSWDTGGAAPGYYRIRATLRTLHGALLDRREETVRVGRPGADLTGLSAEPRAFAPGEAVDLRATVVNTGSTELEGEVVFRASDGAGRPVAELRQGFSGLAPGASVPVGRAWDTAGLPEGTYRVAAFAAYDGQTTDARTVEVGTAAARPGDLDGDGDVDRDDLDILLLDRRKSVAESACGEACDLDGDGRITVLDARKLVLLCTRPRCAVE